jgi:hypothetical protein
LANSGSYAPRAGLVSPGLDPITGAINTVKGPASNPYGVDQATQGQFAGTTGTAPVVATGGQQGLKDRLAVMNEQRQMSGGTPIQQALERARLENTQAHTNYLNTLPEERRQDRKDAQNEKIAAQAAARDQATREKNADTVPKLTKEIEDTTGKGSSVKWMADFASPYGHRGRVVEGKWLNDPNGDQYALPESADAGTAGNEIPDGTAKSAIKTIAPLDTLNKWKERSQNIIEGGGRYVAPTSATQTAPGGGGGGIPKVSSPAEAMKLPKGSQFYDPNGVLRTVP